MRVYIDTDVALGARRGDVDDGFALAACLRARDVELVGISTVFGNTDARTAARCARQLVAAAGARVEVTEGADDEGRMSLAAERIAALPAGTELLALGPLTNVAQALRRDPALPGRITVSLVGGNLSSWGRWPPYWPHEFNLARDAGAAHAVFRSEVPRRIYPLDTCRRLTVGARQLLRLSHQGSLARRLARASWRWLALAPLRRRALAFPLWDLVPALDVLGLLAGRVIEHRRLACRGRGLLVDDGGARVATCLRDFDAAASLAAFQSLLD